ncbi:ATP-binding protein [Mycobacterium ulcerans]|uniref:ATP-binding protein n=1 Tax=Mycobacterium ulcerans TaxID=1809 RepID=A0ABY3VI89_MYCUL|nr:ATP-binding protein [Mycobacterium ulcerans]MEB3906583.1 ATP-binding protein [Mycobacterium ulcerans]MEB3910746.1 ATP-binding protein [Mycobacterium ulcerans]MEB3920997.1 ATP-binding protein [Mycobacterium ulcerans]MEB3925103.1 ATP-binding protein [Mycobacterium ulcerans]MEB3929250.1 ATP-binding protein [Mycobacterium ulcerans]
MTEDPVIRELSAAVERSPEVVELRLHLAALLADRGRHAEALGHCSALLAKDTANAEALSLLQRCSAALAAPVEVVPAQQQQHAPDTAGFDWSKAEKQVADIIEPAFVEAPPDVVGGGDFDVVQRSQVRLADITGMADAKQQLELSLLGPLRNPELMKAYKVSARGGLLLYGPPGCGKSYLAKAVSGELGASFYQVGIADVLHRWFGDSERSIRAVFDNARRNAPCVLFFDEVDALGHRRSALSGSAGLRTVVNSILEELDSAASSNDGVYVLGATNAPWDVDPALRRPGRFDRMIFVGLPDAEARAGIVRVHLRDRPVAGIDPRAIANRTDGFSGADLAHICDSATQIAMAESMRAGQVRPVMMADIDAAAAQIRPSTGPWFETARNVVEFANNDGTYDDLAKYLRRRKIR